MNTPREIDTQLAAINAPRYQFHNAIRDANARKKLGWVQRDPKYLAELEQKIAVAQEAIAAIDKAAEPLEAIYQEQRWTRFFLVPGGHLHSSQYCQSLHWNTALGWLPEYSGHSEAEIVELGGESCCTICYPSAPVDRPSMLPVHIKDRETKAAEEAEKAAKRAAKNAKAINEDGTEWRFPSSKGGYSDHFKTIRSVELAVHRITEDILRYHLYNWATAEENAERLQHYKNDRETLTAKLQERTRKPAAEYAAEIEAKVRKKLKIS